MSKNNVQNWAHRRPSRKNWLVSSASFNGFGIPLSPVLSPLCFTPLVRSFFFFFLVSAARDRPRLWSTTRGEVGGGTPAGGAVACLLRKGGCIFFHASTGHDLNNVDHDIDRIDHVDHDLDHLHLGQIII